VTRTGRAADTRLAAATWVRRLHADYRVLTSRLGASTADATLAAAAPRLADSRFADELDGVLERVRRDGQRPGIALAIGRRELVHDRPDEALRWLAQAQSRATAQTPALVARVAFLLGGIYIGRNELIAADAVLAWAEGMLDRRSLDSGDVLHLRALIAEARGDRDIAMAHYRRVLQRAGGSLTPMTRVLALRNLAEALAHSEPQESVGLYGLALAVIDADELDPAMRCAIDNGMGYALLCSGDIEGARLKLGQALAEAERVRSQRVQLYARFNLSIVEELGGQLEAADTRLRAVEADARRHGLEELARWAQIRLAWIHVRSGAPAEGAAALRDAFPSSPGRAYREAVATLTSILRLDEKRASSRAELSKLAATYRARGDALMDFTLTLWLAHADAIAGRVGAARRNVARACALASARGFRVGTSWWAPELASVARAHATSEFADLVDRLITPPAAAHAARERDVLISRDDGAVSVDGELLDETVWRVGRSGSGVLRRYFRALLSAYPAALLRDGLADLLWPQSEGDKAVRNLYTSTKDLRRVLAGIPGTGLQVGDGRYCLTLAPNVRVR
jgi:tetratricopeptide (TPR) repeat protein